MKTPHSKAAEIASIIQQVTPFLRTMANQAYSLVNQDNQQQAVLDALPSFGISATEALGIYSAMHGALSAIGQSDGVTAPDLNTFQPQPDGTVLYVAPPKLEVDEPELP